MIRCKFYSYFYLITEYFSNDKLKFISNKLGIKADLLEPYIVNYVGSIFQDTDILPLQY